MGRRIFAHSPQHRIAVVQSHIGARTLLKEELDKIHALFFSREHERRLGEGVLVLLISIVDS